MTRYLLDASVFIQARNLHYGFDFCPAFWDWVVEQNRSGKVASIEKVADELHVNACIGLGLRCVTPYAMLRRERARFVLGLGREVA